MKSIQLSQPLGAGYPVALPVFQGPLDLLLQLIEKQKLDINEVSLVVVTDSYLQMLDQIEEIEPSELTEFMDVASRLIYIKSRTLLPKPPADEDEEEEDAGEALVRQLLEYQKFKAVAASLRERQEQYLRTYLRTAPAPEVERRVELESVDVAKLHAALIRALKRIPDDPPMPKLRTYTVTVEERMDYIRSLTKSKNQPPTEKIAFETLLSQNRTRTEVIVTFLAILELIKQHEIEAMQDDVFGSISIHPKITVHDATSAELVEASVSPSTSSRG